MVWTTLGYLLTFVLTMAITTVLVWIILILAATHNKIMNSDNNTDDEDL